MVNGAGFKRRQRSQCARFEALVAAGYRAFALCLPHADTFIRSLPATTKG